MLELKGWWTPQQVRIVTDLIYHYGVQDRVVMASFDRLTLANLWDVAPAFPRVIIQHTLPWKPVILARSVGAIAVVTSAASVKRHPSVVAQMHKAGLQLVLYTLDTSTLWKRAQGLGIDGIITDTPSHLGTWIAKSRTETVVRAGNSQHSG
jgi:glycerophosphoryl diester phosphodiesterase